MNIVCIVLCSSLFMAVNHSSAMQRTIRINKISSDDTTDIDEAVKQFNATKLEDFFADNNAMKNVLYMPYQNLQDLFLAKAKILHHPKMREAIEQRLKNETSETLKRTLNHYRTHIKDLVTGIKKNHPNCPDIVRQAVLTEIAYYDLLLSTAVYHKEMLAHTTFFYDPIFSYLSPKAAIGIGITLVALLAYYGYTAYKEDTTAADPED